MSEPADARRGDVKDSEIWRRDVLRRVNMRRVKRADWRGVNTGGA